ncbi:hypothetical protein ABZ860_38440 [Microbispora sp. NPDC046973]|uniref:hypothetical protein n=1 Tax=Microbispora sp. NPDC046973 TaxID=3155022 RepID=UPI0033CBBAF7
MEDLPFQRMTGLLQVAYALDVTPVGLSVAVAALPTSSVVTSRSSISRQSSTALPSRWITVASNVAS